MHTGASESVRISGGVPRISVTGVTKWDTDFDVSGGQKGEFICNKSRCEISPVNGEGTGLWEAGWIY